MSIKNSSDYITLNQELKSNDFRENKVILPSLKINNNASNTNSSGLSNIRRDRLNVYNFKKLCNENLTKDLKIKFSDFKENNNILSDIQKNIVDKKKLYISYEEILNYTEELVSSIDIGRHFYDFTINNSSSKYFGKVSNYIYDNYIYKDIDKIKSIKKDKYFKDDQLTLYSPINKNSVSKESLKKHFLIDIFSEKNIFNENTSLNLSNNSILSMLMVNLSRGMFTLYPNTFDYRDQYNDLDIQTSLVVDNNSNIIPTTELDELEIFKHINTDYGFYDSIFYKENSFLYKDIVQNNIANKKNDRVHQLILDGYGYKQRFIVNEDGFETENFLNFGTSYLLSKQHLNNESSEYLYEDSLLQLIFSRSFLLNIYNNIYDVNMREINYDDHNILIRLYRIIKAYYIAGRDSETKKQLNIGYDFRENINIRNAYNNGQISSLNNSRDLQEYARYVLRDFVNLGLTKRIPAIHPWGNYFRIEKDKISERNNLTNYRYFSIFDKDIGNYYHNKNPLAVDIERNDIQDYGYDTIKNPYNIDAFFAIKLDSLVKRIKIKKLKKENKFITIISDAIKSVNNKNTKNLLFLNTNNANNQLYQENTRLEKVYINKNNKDLSHFNFDFKKSNNISSILKGIANNENKNQDIDVINNEINEALSVYYSNENFSNSSVFFEKILTNIQKEKEIKDVNYTDITNTQFLFLNYISNFKSSKTDVVDAISNMFLKIAISKYKNTNLNDFNTKNIKSSDFVYNKADNSNPELSDFEYQSNVINDKYKKYLNDLNTENKDMFFILDNVIDEKHLNSIHESLSFQKTSNYKLMISDTYLTFDNSSRNITGNPFSIQFLNLEGILPFVCIYDYNHLTEVNPRLSNKQISLKSYYDLGLKFENENFVLDSLIDAKAKIYVHNNNGNDSRSDAPYRNQNESFRNILSFIESINFDINLNVKKFANNSKYENTVFNSIFNLINDIILYIDNQYENMSFDNQIQVDNYITKNNFLINLVSDVLHIYGKIYCDYIFELHKNLMFDTISRDSVAKDEYTDSNLSDYLDNFINNHPKFQLKNYKPIKLEEFFINFFARSSDLRDNIIDEDFINQNSILNEVLREINDKDQNLENAFNINSNFALTDKQYLQYIYYVLLKSDICLATNFDLLKGFFIFYKNEISQFSLSESYSNFENNLSLEEIENIFVNIKDKFFVSNIIKNLNYNNEVNNLYYNNLINEDRLDNSIDSSVNIAKLFEIYNDIINKEIDFSSRDNVIINNDFYIYHLTEHDLLNMEYDSLIEVKIDYISKTRLSNILKSEEHLYDSKIRYFSPLILNDILDNEGIAIVNFLDKTVRFQNEDNFLNNQVLNNIVLKHFPDADDDLINSIKLNIYKSHTDAFGIESFINLMYSVKLKESVFKNNITEFTYNIIQKINSFDFFSIFGIKKEKFIDNCFTEIEEGYQISSDNKYFIQAIEFFKFVNYLVSIDKKDILNKFSSNICIPIYSDDLIRSEDDFNSFSTIVSVKVL